MIGKMVGDLKSIDVDYDDDVEELGTEADEEESPSTGKPNGKYGVCELTQCV